MWKNILCAAAALLMLAPTAPATVRASIVTSFDGRIVASGFPRIPYGVTYGNGYVWLSYGPDMVTKRRPGNGSIVSYIYPANSNGCALGWEETNKYLYGAAWSKGVMWWSSRTGAPVGSIPLPSNYVGQWNGIDYDEGAPAQPLWVCQMKIGRFKNTIANMTSTGSIVTWLEPSWPEPIYSLAFDRDTGGGPYLYVGLHAAPPRVLLAKPNDASIISSFVPPVGNYSIADISWDGNYLWLVESGPYNDHSGWVYRLKLRTYPNVAPASLGKIKALFR